MPVVQGISFPQTRLERLVDRLRHWWHAPTLPTTTEPDWDPTLAEILVTALDD